MPFRADLGSRADLVSATRPTNVYGTERSGLTMKKITVWILLLIIFCTNLRAQHVLVLASANDNPNQLINGIFDGTTLNFRPSVASGGTSNGSSNFLEFGQVRAHQSTISGCTLLAQTHGRSGNVSLYTVSPQGDIDRCQASLRF